MTIQTAMPNSVRIDRQTTKIRITAAVPVMRTNLPVRTHQEVWPGQGAMDAVVLQAGKGLSHEPPPEAGLHPIELDRRVRSRRRSLRTGRRFVSRREEGLAQREDATYTSRRAKSFNSPPKISMPPAMATAASAI